MFFSCCFKLATTKKTDNTSSRILGQSQHSAVKYDLHNYNDATWYFLHICVTLMAVVNWFLASHFITSSHVTSEICQQVAARK